MNYKRGDIVIVPFPFVQNSGEQDQKARPAMVVSNHQISRRYSDKILAGITKTCRGSPTACCEEESAGFVLQHSIRPTQFSRTKYNKISELSAGRLTAGSSFVKDRSMWLSGFFTSPIACCGVLDFQST